ncbi:hypothetical protein BGAL_0254g00180 [Botrytis galanthina]|uniref:Uncharacterized protein n=1 Tax=Botrytis galanthina TaxID=278940 RepID=A0A4V4HU77_9HELO|nr:hypothetical protein BGAL_0254g00180 [Botrytis galanthina]
MPNRSNSNDQNKAQGDRLTPLYLAGETMKQSFDRIEREAQRLRVDPDSLLEHSIPRIWENSAERLYMPGNRQANNSTSCYEVTSNPQYRSGTSSSGQHSSSGQQASHGSGAVISNGNASRQSNPGAQRDNSGWNTASPHAQNTGTSAWNGRDQPGGENFQSYGRSGHQ